jgi:hypothetical protein
VSKRFGFWPHITHVIVLTFKEIKHLSDYRTVGPSDYQTVGLLDCQIIGWTLLHVLCSTSCLPVTYTLFYFLFTCYIYFVLLPVYLLHLLCSTSCLPVTCTLFYFLFPCYMYFVLLPVYLLHVLCSTSCSPVTWVASQIAESN